MPTVSGFTTASPGCADALPACTHLIRIASGETSAVVGDADIFASQRTLALAPLAAAAVKVRALAAVTGRSASAALQSSGGPGSAGWLLPPFTCPAFYLTRALELPSERCLTSTFRAKLEPASTAVRAEPSAANCWAPKENTQDRAHKRWGG
jgi:hypothetical protein